uniref:Uncharacterized protein n=1 Tax=Fagus sylvatica TaxID=28930 RepID=A0A2N9HGI2_FAGSY
MAPGSRGIGAVFVHFSGEDSDQTGDAFGEPRVPRRSWSRYLSNAPGLVDQLVASRKDSAREGGYFDVLGTVGKLALPTLCKVPDSRKSELGLVRYGSATRGHRSVFGPFEGSFPIRIPARPDKFLAIREFHVVHECVFFPTHPGLWINLLRVRKTLRASVATSVGKFRKFQHSLISSACFHARGRRSSRCRISTILVSSESLRYLLFNGAVSSIQLSVWSTVRSNLGQPLVKLGQPWSNLVNPGQTLGNVSRTFSLGVFDTTRLRWIMRAGSGSPRLACRHPRKSRGISPESSRRPLSNGMKVCMNRSSDERVMAPGSRGIGAVFVHSSGEDSDQTGDASGEPRVPRRSWSRYLSNAPGLVGSTCLRAGKTLRAKAAVREEKGVFLPAQATGVFLVRLRAVFRSGFRLDRIKSWRSESSTLCMNVSSFQRARACGSTCCESGRLCAQAWQRRNLGIVGKLVLPIFQRYRPCTEASLGSQDMILRTEAVGMFLMPRGHLLTEIPASTGGALDDPKVACVLTITSSFLVRFGLRKVSNRSSHYVLQNGPGAVSSIQLSVWSIVRWTLVGLGTARSNLGRTWSTLVKLGQPWSNLGEMCPGPFSLGVFDVARLRQDHAGLVRVVPSCVPTSEKIPWLGDEAVVPVDPSPLMTIEDYIPRAPSDPYIAGVSAYPSLVREDVPYQEWFERVSLGSLMSLHEVEGGRVMGGVAMDSHLIRSSGQIERLESEVLRLQLELSVSVDRHTADMDRVQGEMASMQTEAIQMRRDLASRDAEVARLAAAVRRLEEQLQGMGITPVTGADPSGLGQPSSSPPRDPVSRDWFFDDPPSS